MPKFKFAPDSPLEGNGFELLVPRHKSGGFPQHCGGSAGLLNGTTGLFSLFLLHFEPLHRAGLGHGLNRLWLAALRGGVFIGRPFCEFGPADWDQVLGIFGPHFDSAVEADGEVLA